MRRDRSRPCRDVIGPTPSGRTRRVARQLRQREVHLHTEPRVSIASIATRAASGIAPSASSGGTFASGRRSTARRGRGRSRRPRAGRLLPGRISSTGTPVRISAPASRRGFGDRGGHRAHPAGDVPPGAVDPGRLTEEMVRHDVGGTLVARRRRGPDHALGHERSPHHVRREERARRPPPPRPRPRAGIPRPVRNVEPGSGARRARAPRGAAAA